MSDRSGPLGVSRVKGVKTPARCGIRVLTPFTPLGVPRNAGPTRSTDAGLRAQRERGGLRAFSLLISHFAGLAKGSVGLRHAS
jgi:hypothetical protein